MTASAEAAPDRIRIGVIGSNDQTVSELLAYLAQVGTSARRLPPLFDTADGKEARESLQALVIFPDDFESELVDKLLGSLSTDAPELFQLIVTRKPQRFATTSENAKNALNRCVIPRPVFCWLIVDAIRAHLDRDG